MAKKRRTATSKKQPNIVYRPADSKKDVEAAIKKIEEHYELGRESREESENRAPYGKTAEIEGPKLRLWHARKFAEAYTPKQKDALIKQCRDEQTALGLSLLTRLVTITDRRKRKRLESNVIRERWSKSKLDLEIRRQFGRREFLGRNPRRPRDADEALSQLVGLCLRLTRWGQQNTDWDPVTGRFPEFSEDNLVNQLPGNVSEELRKALRAVWRLQNASEEALALHQ